jgi:hypothetical protein
MAAFVPSHRQSVGENGSAAGGGEGKPSRLTSAAERQSDSSAYSPIGKLSIAVSS